MRFLEEMYVGEGIKNRHKIQRKLKRGVGMVDVYVISISNGSDQLECMKSAYFKQKAIRDSVGMIVGLAKGYSQAQRLIVSMIEEVVRETGNANVKEYILHKNNETVFDSRKTESFLDLL